jgi:uncharacterized protein YlxW (UPF0749 family)
MEAMSSRVEVPSRAPEGAGRPDASMLLLTNLMNNTLDEGYAEVAARRAATGHSGPARPRLLGGVAAALVALLLVTAYLDVQRTKSAAAAARKDLVHRITVTTAHTDRLAAELERLRAQVGAAHERALAETASGSAAGTALREAELLTGVAPVTGGGLEVTVDSAHPGDRDTTDPRADGQPDPGRVLDNDLQRLVNGLWAAGAEAVAVNGQRLTALSAIRSAGDAILVDFRPLSPPYVVSAVGDVRSLPARFGDGPAGRAFRTLQQAYGIRYEATTKKKLRLPGASSMSLHVARPDQAGERKASS